MLIKIVIWIVIIGFIIWCISRIMDYRNFLKIKPLDIKDFTRIQFADQSYTKLPTHKNTIINYIGVDNKRRVSFPESAKPKKKYYITEISFDPNIKVNQTVKGHTGSALAGGVIAGPVGAIIGASRKKKIKTETTEKKAECYVTMIDEELNEAFTLNLLCKTDKYKELRKRYKISETSFNQITAPYQKAEEQVEKVNDDSNKDINDRLENLKELHDKELITDQEYSDKKKQILGI